AAGGQRGLERGCKMLACRSDAIKRVRASTGLAEPLLRLTPTYIRPSSVLRARRATSPGSTVNLISALVKARLGCRVGLPSACHGESAANMVCSQLRIGAAPNRYTAQFWPRMR